MNIKKLLFYVGITLLIGFLPNFFIKIGDTYKSFNKPPLSPPGILFPIVWSILFILMGISIYRIMMTNSDKKKEARLIYFIQLIINACWTPIFFGLKEYFLAFLWILMLILLVVTMILIFFKIDKISAYLNIPYLIWLLFACYLNFGVFILN
ncbi:MAG: tryptophan-rich sensory protein [Bacilli bacterium]|nr:tryptophan-rich sensory protein [Bacilli bacterium]